MAPEAKMTVLVRAQQGPWSVPVRSRHSAWSTCSKRSTSRPQSSPGRLQITHQRTAIPSFFWFCGHQSESEQHSASSSQPLRHAAGNADGSTSLLHHWSHVPRILWYRCVDDPVAWPLGLPCCLEVRSTLSICPVLVAGKASLGRDLQAVQ